MDTTTFEEEFVGVVYKTNAKDKGLMLNVCPWCGGSVRFWKPVEGSESEDPEK